MKRRQSPKKNSQTSWVACIMCLRLIRSSSLFRCSPRTANTIISELLMNYDLELKGKQDDGIATIEWGKRRN